MAFKSQKAIGLATLSALSLFEFLQLQQAQAVPTTYSGAAVANPHGGQVQVNITVDGGVITGISTPLQPGGGNASYSSAAIGPMTSRAYAALPIPSNPNVTASALVGIVATIQGVSGASQVSAAWKQSLQSAISNAGSAIGVQVAPTTPAAPSTPVTPTLPAPTFSAPAASSASPSSSSSATTSTGATSNNGVPAICQTMAPIVNKLPEVTSAPSPEGTPTPYGAPIPSGIPTPISTIRSGENRSTVTQNQTMLQYAIQSFVKTVTKTEVQTQIITCNILPTATPTVTVFVTTTPSAPDVSFVIQPGAGVVLKSFTCSITKNGVTTKKVFKAKVVKCPSGYKLVKK